VSETERTCVSGTRGRRFVSTLSDWMERWFMSGVSLSSSRMTCSSSCCCCSCGGGDGGGLEVGMEVVGWEDMVSDVLGMRDFCGWGILVVEMRGEEVVHYKNYSLEMEIE